MTLFTRRPARPTRTQLETDLERLRQQREMALAKARAIPDQVASWLASRADGYREDAAHLDRLAGTPNEPRSIPLTAEQRRAIAAELDALAVDIEHTLGRKQATA